jgi:hypothetical protein
MSSSPVVACGGSFRGSRYTERLYDYRPPTLSDDNDLALALCAPEVAPLSPCALLIRCVEKAAFLVHRCR